MTLAQSYVGIDIARAHLDIFDDACGRTARIVNEPAAIAAVLASLAGRAITVVFEATGPYDRALRQALASAGIPAMRVNPARARDFARAASYLAKTDAIDARMLAAMGRAIALPAAAPIDPAREELSFLSRQRDRLVEVRAEEKRRLLQSPSADVCASIERHMAWLTGEIGALEAAIAACIAAHPQLAAIRTLLTTAPGVGEVTATTLIAHMPELGQRSPKAIAALAGLAPFNNDSGERRGRRSIRGGRGHVRRVLYMAALSAIRRVPRFAAAYAAIAARAKSKKVAIIAIARKLLVALNAMLANKQPFRA
jgi:transposase